MVYLHIYLISYIIHIPHSFKFDIFYLFVSIHNTFYFCFRPKMTWSKYGWLATLVVLQAVIYPGHAVDYIYYSSPGDSVGHFAGMWGGPIDANKNGSAEDLRQSGFHCAYMYDGGFYTGLGIKGMFLDPISKRVLMDLTESFDNRVSVIEGPICTEKPECSTDLGPVKVYFTLAENTDPIKSAEPGPFAMWNSTVYFVVQRWNHTGDETGVLQHRLELRKLAGCEELYPFTVRKKINVDSCSVRLATLYESRSQPGEETFKTADHLYILERSDGELVFITQIYNWTRSDNTDVSLGMTLLAATSSGTVHMLRHTPLPVYYYTLNLVETGGLSWRDGILCWSAIEVIQCARWDGYAHLEEVQTVLKPGQASQVCVGKLSYLNIQGHIEAVIMIMISE